MARKRKSTQDASCARKQPRLCSDRNKSPSSALTSCYPRVLSLRDYFLTRLPVTSKVRRKRLKKWNDSEQQQLLDTCLVGVLTDPTPDTRQERARELVAFTQTQATGSECPTGRGQSCSIEEIVDFVIWFLFKKCPLTLTRPKHLICNGLQKGAVPHWKDVKSKSSLVVPGIYQQHPDDNQNVLKRSPWDQYLSLLGMDGEAILSSLLLDCGLFVRLDQGSNNFLQISGIPISELSVLSALGSEPSLPKSDEALVSRKLTDISFVRNRILYAKPSLNKDGYVQFGLKHVHVLQRYCALDQREHTVHVMKHIFPRQFGLHNVFTSRVGQRESSQRFQDYTYREGEMCEEDERSKLWLPRRLRGAAEELVRKIRQHHARISYTQLLRHYCSNASSEFSASSLMNDSERPLPPASIAFMTQPKSLTPLASTGNTPGTQSEGKASFLFYATPSAQVSAFCRSVVTQVLPKNCLGHGVDGEHNRAILLRNIDRFVKMRRYETLALHEVCNNLRIGCIDWLRPPKLRPQAKSSKPDMRKRLELLHEMLYYIFDSLLMPLIRSNFYATESGIHRNKLFFFRHDTWRRLSEPSLTMLRLNIYRPLKPKEVRRIFDSRTLGYSNVRLLPKAEGTRPITNLKRGMLRLQGNKRLLGPSINAQLSPVFSALGYERQQDPAQLGGAIFSVGGLHEKLKRFRNVLTKGQKLYFVKVDIQSCFDTIPQSHLLERISKIIRHRQYRTTRYSELKPSDSKTTGAVSKLRQKFANLARPTDEGAVFSASVAADIARDKSGIVLVHTGNQKIWQHHELLTLLQEHVQSNIVKIGKKHFKQTTGIPQGSVLSSLLCSFFYSEFESRHLDFLSPASSLLVRLIDDFLLMTTDKQQAIQFLQVLTQGHQDYGISVNPDKTLANFELQLGLHRIPRHPNRDEFPFCGMVIDTTTLEVRKDWQRRDTFANNGLTVDWGRRAGATFRRKVLLSFKMQLHAMLLDAQLNSHSRIMTTYLEVFEETAMKMHQYVRSFSSRARPSAAALRELILELIKVGLKLGQTRQSSCPAGQARSPVSRSEMLWIASMAFERVLTPKQTEYKDVLQWLRHLRSSCDISKETGRRALNGTVDGDIDRRVLHSCVY